MQFQVLLAHGLVPGSTVLDIGCGALRAGYWLIHFLRPGGYHGIEPFREMVDAAREQILEPGIEAEKQPIFAHNDDFDLSVFGNRVAFDFMLARSIWTHASRSQIETMLDGFAEVGAHDATFLVSYLPSSLRARTYTGQSWVGRGSHSTDLADKRMVHHSRRRIRAACESRGLRLQEVKGWLAGNQEWLAIIKP